MWPKSARRCVHPVIVCVCMCVYVLLYCGWQELISDYGCKLAEWLSLIITNKTMASLSAPSLALTLWSVRWERDELIERKRGWERVREWERERGREKGCRNLVPESKRFHNGPHVHEMKLTDTTHNTHLTHYTPTAQSKSPCWLTPQGAASLKMSQKVNYTSNLKL